jgi:hypothetical protein
MNNPIAPVIGIIGINMKTIITKAHFSRVTIEPFLIVFFHTLNFIMPAEKYLHHN